MKVHVVRVWLAGWLATWLIGRLVGGWVCGRVGWRVGGWVCGWVKLTPKALLAAWYFFVSAQTSKKWRTS
jgi:hypothetical protein